MEEKNTSFCESCQHKTFNGKTGLTCGLTEKKPDFDLECKTFEFSSENHTYAYNSVVINAIAVSKVKRVTNLIVDSILVMLALFIIVPNITDFSPISLFIVSLAFCLYYFLMEFKTQRTLGKMTTNTVVLNEKTLQKPRLNQIAIRSIFRLPFLSVIDAVSFLLDLDLHDNVSKTKVYKNEGSNIDKARILIEINQKYASSEN